LFLIVLTLLFVSSCVSEIALTEGLEECCGDGDSQVVRGVVEVDVVGIADRFQQLGPSTPSQVGFFVGVFVGAVAYLVSVAVLRRSRIRCHPESEPVGRAAVSVGRKRRRGGT
jgi:hypothetical protein